MTDGRVSVNFSGSSQGVPVGVMPEGLDLLDLPWFRRRVEAAVFPRIEEAPARGGARGGVVVTDGRAGRERVRDFAGVVAYRGLRHGEARSFLCEARSSLRVVGLDQWENARSLRECFAGGVGPEGLSVIDFVSLVDLLGDALRSVWADCVEAGVGSELRRRLIGDLRVLCFGWLHERVPVGAGSGERSSVWDLVEALESAARRADGGSVGEAVMLWLEMLRHGPIWPREVPEEALSEVWEFRYRSALTGGGVELGDSGGGESKGVLAGMRRALVGEKEGSYLVKPEGERREAAERELRSLVDWASSSRLQVQGVLRVVSDWGGTGWLPEALRNTALFQLGQVGVRAGDEAREYCRAFYECLRVVEQRLLETGRDSGCVARVEDLVARSVASVLVEKYGNLGDCADGATLDVEFEAVLRKHAGSLRFGSRR